RRDVVAERDLAKLPEARVEHGLLRSLICPDRLVVLLDRRADRVDLAALRHTVTDHAADVTTRKGRLVEPVPHGVGVRSGDQCVTELEVDQRRERDAPDVEAVGDTADPPRQRAPEVHLLARTDRDTLIIVDDAPLLVPLPRPAEELVHLHSLDLAEL